MLRLFHSPSTPHLRHHLLRNKNRSWRCHLLYHTSHNHPQSRIATNDVCVAWGFNPMRFNAIAIGRGDATCFTTAQSPPQSHSDERCVCSVGFQPHAIQRNKNRSWQCHLLYHTSHNHPQSRIATNDVFVAWGFEPHAIK